MKRCAGWMVSAAALAAATGASAQGLARYESTRAPLTVVSDVGGSYAAMPPDAPPRYVPYGYAPALLPLREVYGVLHENGYAPLGLPQQRGMVYIIAAINGDGDDGRLVIDARNGRILRFTPAFRMGHVMNNDEIVVGYGPAAPLPPVGDVRRAPQPPAPLPRVASRTPSVPLPKPAPHAVVAPKVTAPVAAAPAPAPAQQSAAVQNKPVETTGAAPVAAAPAVSATPADKPGAAIQPTQDMPAAQGLE
jgi:hypothetical protein